MTDDHSAARDVIAGQLDVYPDPDCILAALTTAGYEIVQRGDGVRLSINRDRIGYDEGFNAFKRFVLEEYRPDWEPGDWQIIAEAVWSAIDAAIAAGADPVTPPDSDVPTKAALRAAIELTNGSSYWCGVTTMGNQGFVDKFDEAKAALDALIDRLPIATGADDGDLQQDVAVSND